MLAPRSASGFTMFPRSAHGFTMMELMIAILIIAILAAIALPSYQDSIRKSKRAEGKAALLDLQNRMERFFIDRNTYLSACIGACGVNSVLASATTEHSYYTLSISASAINSYTLQATPAFADALCGNLTLTNTGIKGESGSATAATQCW